MIPQIFALWALGAVNPDVPMDRSRTLLQDGGLSALMEFDRMIRDSGVPLAHILPRPCISDLDGSNSCPEHGGFVWLDSAAGGEMRLHPVLGFEGRLVGEDEVIAADLGTGLSGGIGPASFTLDARIFSEFQASPSVSYDGEYVERQTDGNSSHFDYASYSRYRTRLTLETPVGRFGAGRETQNWGPSAYHALVLNASSIPYTQFDWTVHLGPFTVRSLVADLSIPGPGESRVSEDSRTMFAHRYEWRVTRDFAIGASEALFLYNRSAPICFLPVVPLFMQKGLWLENINNGELAFDFDLRVRRGWRVYGEFLIDDMTSPTTIFDDQWKSKWATTIGSQVAFPVIGGVRTGSILEWSRIEPWVYTHYTAYTSQALNQGLPVGDPLGPNSQSLLWKTFASFDRTSIALRGELAWKGKTRGSQGTDTLHDNESTRKSFLEGASTPGFRIGPEIEWSKGWLTLMASGFIQMNGEVWGRTLGARNEPSMRGRGAIQF